MKHKTRRTTAEPGLLDRLLEKTSRTFALSIPRLPEPTCLEVTVAYLLFRIADTLEDATGWGRSKQLAELNALAALLREPAPARARELAHRWLEDPPVDHEGYQELLAELPAVLEAWLDLSPTARRLVGEHTLRTIHEMSSFVARVGEDRELHLHSPAEVRAYCYAVAGIVGEMLTELFLLDREKLRAVAPALRERAAKFGEGLQLVNILKDSATDAGEGRHYLPEECDRAEFFALARRDLEEAGRYVVSLQEAGAPRGLLEFTALPVLLAWGTLRRVEQQGPGAKLTRPEVQRMVAELQEALDCNSSLAGALSGPGSDRT